MIKFITGNPNKFREVQGMLKPITVEQLNIDLEEIQSIDTAKIIKHKLRQAFKHHSGPFIIEDSSLVLEVFGNKLPGPFIKYFNDHLGPKNLSKIAIKMRKQKAKASVLVAFAKNRNNVLFFQGSISGKIVLPRGKYGFGYDPIFQPNESSLTLGQMKSVSHFAGSAREKAVNKLKKYLLKSQ